MKIPSIESLLAELDKVKAERDEYLRRCDALKSLGDMACDQIEIRENALREAKEVIKFLQCNTDDYYDSAREASAQGDKAISTINKVLGEE